MKRALISLSNKTGLAEFARGLAALGIEIVSTGGTAKAIRDCGLAVTDVSAVTGSPEMMDGRVKTLHPKIHGGILALRDNATHREEADRNGISFIDMVVVNLYPFKETIARKGVTDEDAIENIDIGGPAMVRSAAKNHAYVTIVTDPADYTPILEEIKREGGTTTLRTRRSLAQKAFAHTADYDRAIAGYMAGAGGETFPSLWRTSYVKVADLRYGENPHQRAALYRTEEAVNASIAQGTIRWGKELSYNNILDLNSALQLALEFDSPSAVIVKHNNPCGAGCAQELSAAVAKALSGDPVSAYGGILAVNRPIDVATAELIAGKENFFESIAAPALDEKAFAIITTKPKWGKNVRIVEYRCGENQTSSSQRDIRGIAGGILLQTPDNELFAKTETVTTTPSAEQMRDLLFAWKVCKHVRSNAIVFAKDETVVGVGAGQMSRLDSVFIAVKKAGERAKGAVLASDAFFPFKDALEAALDAGIAAVIHPGGSIRDQEVIETAAKRGIPMIVSGMRHFRH